LAISVAVAISHEMAALKDPPAGINYEVGMVSMQTKSPSSSTRYESEILENIWNFKVEIAIP